MSRYNVLKSESRWWKVLVNMERSKKRRDVLVMGFVAWMSERRPRPLSVATRRNYKRAIEWALKRCENKEVALLSGDERTVRLVLGWLPPHPSSQNGMTSALSCFFNYLIDMDLRPDNPVSRLPRAPRLRATPRPVSLEWVRSYEETAVGLGPVHEAIAVLGLYQGFRVSEIANAQWRWWFTAADRMWCDVTGKGNKTGRNAVHPRTEKMLTRLRASHNDPVYLFPSDHIPRQPSTWKTIHRRHYETVEAAGIPEKVVLHRLRHTFATYLRAGGADVATVQKALRHSHISSTMIYMDILDAEQTTAIDHLDYDDHAN